MNIFSLQVRNFNILFKKIVNKVQFRIGENVIHHFTFHLHPSREVGREPETI